MGGGLQEATTQSVKIPELNSQRVGATGWKLTQPEKPKTVCTEGETCEEFGEWAVTGDLMMGMAQNSGLRAFITDTHICDHDGLEPLNIALFAKGLNPNSPYKADPGKIGLPMSIGGYIVESGDLIVEDADNVAVVKHADIDAVLADLAGTSEKEKGAGASITEVQKFMEIADEALASVEVKWVD